MLIRFQFFNIDSYKIRISFIQFKFKKRNFNRIGATTFQYCICLVSSMDIANSEDLSFLCKHSFDTWFDSAKLTHILWTCQINNSYLFFKRLIFRCRNYSWFHHTVTLKSSVERKRGVQKILKSNEVFSL